MRAFWPFIAVCFGLALGLPAAAHAQPPELRVVSSNGVRSVVEALLPEIERAVGSPLDIEFSTASSLAHEITDGASFDVAILTPALIDDLVTQGKIDAASRIEIARAGVGIGARAGTGTRDVGDLAALERTLLEADSVAFTAQGQSRNTIEQAFERLGITDAMQAKTILLGPGEAPVAVAAGEAELVLTLTSEILHVPGLELVGPLPAEVQSYVAFAAGRRPATERQATADALLAFLAGPRFAAELAAHGMESPAR